MGDEGLCLEIIGKRDEKTLLLCRLPVEHEGDHDPDPDRAPEGRRARVEEAAEAAARKMAARPRGEMETMEFRYPCAHCGDESVLEFVSTPMSVRTIKTMEANPSSLLCEVCSEAEERAAGEVGEAELVERRRAASGMPVKWQRQTFGQLDDDPDRSRAIELAAAWSLGDLPGVVLWGDVGRGKTAVAAAAANGILSLRRLRWVAVSELLHALRMGFDAPEYKRAVRLLDPGRGGAGLAALVLDDLDKLKPTEHAVAPLYTAINGWIEAEAPLLVTLNRSLDELADWMPDTFGEAIASRLAGYCKVREVRGRDRRLD